MSQRVLITGGTGNLGSNVRRRLAELGYVVRIMSRREPKPREDKGVEWAVAQLASGEGVRNAMRGVDSIVHTASSATSEAVEIDGGRHLIDAARAEGVAHFVYISIIGVDRISFSYYKTKLKAERMIASSGLDYSIQRAAQFHRFMAQIIAGLTRLPIVLRPRGWQFQPISAADVANVLAGIVRNGPQGRAPDVAGPEVLTLNEMVHAWMAAQGRRKPIIPIPMPGGLSKGFRAGYPTAPDNAYEGITWGEYLAERFNLGERGTEPGVQTA